MAVAVSQFALAVVDDGVHGGQEVAQGTCGVRVLHQLLPERGMRQEELDGVILLRDLMRGEVNNCLPCMQQLL